MTTQSKVTHSISVLKTSRDFIPYTVQVINGCTGRICIYSGQTPTLGSCNKIIAPIYFDDILDAVLFFIIVNCIIVSGLLYIFAFPDRLF